MAKFEGRGACAHCQRAVDVFSDKNGMAYYNCGPCGFRGRHMLRRTSDALLAKVDRTAIEDGAPEPTAAPSPAPARRPTASPAPTPAPTQAPPPKSGGFLSNFTLG